MGRVFSPQGSATDRSFGASSVESGRTAAPYDATVHFYETVDQAYMTGDVSSVEELRHRNGRRDELESIGVDERRSGGVML